MTYLYLTRDERQQAVLEGALPPDALTDEDLADLETRVLEAIAVKLLAHELPREIQ